VDISHNAGLSTIDGFRTLASTESITIADCPSLTRVAGFYRINFVNGPVSIERNPALASVAFLNNCSRIEGTHLCEPQSMFKSGEREALMGLRTLALLSNQLRLPVPPNKDLKVPPAVIDSVIEDSFGGPHGPMHTLGACTVVPSQAL
jgi:hypothetical protein